MLGAYRVKLVCEAAVELEIFVVHASGRAVRIR